MNPKKLRLLKLLIPLLTLGVITIFIMVLRPKKSPANPTKFIKVSGSSYKTSFPSVGMSASLKLDADRAKIEVSRNDSILQLATPLSEKTTLKMEKETLTYSTPQKGIETRYSALPNGLKEEITLYSPPKSNVFELKMDIKNLTFGQNADGQPIFFDQNGKYLYHFEKPFAQDKKGDKSLAINYKIRKRSQLAEGYVLIMEISKDWLNDSNRAYPIIVDPTIIFDYSSSHAEVISRRHRHPVRLQQRNYHPQSVCHQKIPYLPDADRLPTTKCYT